LLGSRIAPTAFAIALIAAGQSSTLTGTLAGQITMEGFLHFRMRPWLRRLITRSLAILPAIVVILKTGEQGTTGLLVLSQVILSLQLPFAVVPLVKFTGSRVRMGMFASPVFVSTLAWLVAGIIIYLNGQLAFEQIHKWTIAAGRYQWLVLGTAVPISGALALLLLWMIVRPEGELPEPRTVSASEVADRASAMSRSIRRVGVALAAENEDAPMLAEAIALARTHGAEILLLHIVEGVGGQYHGNRAGDVEFHNDDKYMSMLAARLRKDVDGAIPAIDYKLGYGNVRREIVRLTLEAKVDILVMGGHGHGTIGDILRGTTIDAVRHGIKIPVLAVRQ
jgi:manganese transport protein